jgi:LPXTG-motif cell wall-anchored protein
VITPSTRPLAVPDGGVTSIGKILAFTGAGSTGAFVLLGALLLVVGCFALVLASRRRRW